jgi:hypothetical protein
MTDDDPPDPPPPPKFVGIFQLPEPKLRVNGEGDLEKVSIVGIDTDGHPWGLVSAYRQRDTDTTQPPALTFVRWIKFAAVYFEEDSTEEWIDHDGVWRHDEDGNTE